MSADCHEAAAYWPQLAARVRSEPRLLEEVGRETGGDRGRVLYGSEYVNRIDHSPPKHSTFSFLF